MFKSAAHHNSERCNCYGSSSDSSQEDGFSIEYYFTDLQLLKFVCLILYGFQLGVGVDIVANCCLSTLIPIWKTMLK